MSSPEVVSELSGEPGHFLFWCPGCKEAHGFNVKGDGSGWTFNGDRLKPTVSPSVRVIPGPGQGRCHLYVRDGQIQFLGDCDHELAGKTVDMEPVWAALWGGQS